MTSAEIAAALGPAWKPYPDTVGAWCRQFSVSARGGEYRARYAGNLNVRPQDDRDPVRAMRRLVLDVRTRAEWALSDAERTGL